MDCDVNFCLDGVFVRSRNKPALSKESLQFSFLITLVQASVTSKASVDFFRSVHKSRLFLDFDQRGECPRPEHRNYRAPVACSIDCDIAA